VAVSIAVMLLTGLTLVPALMRLCGRALLWPTRPGYAHHGGAEGAEAPNGRGVWQRVGLGIAAHPALVAAVCLVVLVPLAAVASTLSPSYDDLRTLPTSDVAVRTAVAIQDHFGSTTEPAVLVIHDPHGGLDSARGAQAISALRTAMAAVPGVQVQAQQAQVAPGGQVAALGLILEAETSSPAAHALVTRMQDALHRTVPQLGRPGLEAVLASDSALTHDQRDQINGDFRFIVLWVSLIIFVILALLVRSLSAPFYLLLTVALSAGSSVGLTVLIFHIILGQQIYYTTPVFAFVFLVALGEDFNILLMARIREEVRGHGLRPGVARAVGATGGTLSSCGLIMAGTFGVLMQFQITFLQQVGFAVAAGVLLDTFVIRPLLVPAIVCLLGRWNWVTVRGVAPLSRAPSSEEAAAMA
jgi:RND superfamily putative drug exporter